MKKFILRSIAATIAVGLFSNSGFAMQQNDLLFSTEELKGIKKEVIAVTKLLKQYKFEGDTLTKLSVDFYNSRLSEARNKDNIDRAYKLALNVLSNGDKENKQFKDGLFKLLENDKTFAPEALRMVLSYNVAKKLGATYEVSAKEMVKLEFVSDSFEKKSNFLRYTMYTGVAGLLALAAYGATIGLNEKVRKDYNAFTGAQAWFKKCFAKEEATA